MKHSRQGLDGSSLKLFGNGMAFLALLLNLSFMLVVSMGAVQAFAASSECDRTYDGDLVLEGNRVLEITEETVCVHGNIVVKDNAKLVLNDVTLRMDKFSPSFWDNWARFDVFDSANVNISNVVFDLPGGAVWLASHDRAVVHLDYVTSSGDSSGVHLEADSDSQMNVQSCSVYEADIFGSAEMTIQDSQLAWAVRMGLNGDKKILLANIAPGMFDNWEFPRDQSVPFHISLQNTSVGAWSIFVGEGADVMIVSSKLDELLLNLGRPKGSLHGLVPGHFSSWSLHADNQIDCVTNVELKDTTTNRWNLGLSGRAEIALNDSTIGLLRFTDAYVDLSLQNTNVHLLEAQDVLGKIAYYASSISGGVEFKNAMLTLTGNLSFSHDSYVSEWRDSTILRGYDVHLVDASGSPAVNASLKVESPNGQRLLATPDEDGHVPFNVTFDDSNYTENWTLRASIDDRTAVRPLNFLSPSPVTVRFSEASGSTTLVPYDGLVIDTPGTYSFATGMFVLEDKNNDGWIIKVDADGVVLIGHHTTLLGGEDHTFETPYDVVGIQMHDRHNITIEGFTIMNYAIGIQSTGNQSHITIKDNKFFDNSERAVEIGDWDYLPFPAQRDQARSNNILIENNYVVGNTKIPTRVVEGKTLPCGYKESEPQDSPANAQCTGIFGLNWWGVRDSAMRGNTVKNTTVSGLRPDMMQNCVVENNVVDFSELGLWSCAGGAFVSSDNVCRNNQIANCRIGLGAGENGRSNLYENNDLHDNLYGMYVLGEINPSKYHFGNQTEKVVNNRMYNNVLAGIGASLDSSSSGSDLNAYIQGNDIFGNGQFGISFDQGSGYVSISNNEIYGNGQDGIILQSTPVVTINGNNIHDNGEWGILAYSKTCSPYCQDAPDQFEGKITLEDNTIGNNGKGPTCGLQLEETTP